jgi:phage-related protein
MTIPTADLGGCRGIPTAPTAEAWMDMREFAQSVKPELLAALADVGVQPDDYALIEQARALVDEVNARLQRRGSRMIYTITFCHAVPVPEAELPVALEVPCD